MIYQDFQKEKTLKRLDDIVSENGSKKPNELTIKTAKDFITNFLYKNVISNKFSDFIPCISFDEYGDISIEFYRERRCLCFDIEGDIIKYTKIWRTNTDTLTQTDTLITDNYLTLLKWLIG